MAKKDDEFDLDDFDLDDFGDFGVDIDGGEDVKDDRTPTTKIKEGFLEGVKETSKDVNFLRSTLTRALPSGYGRAADAIDEMTSVGRDLYDTALSEIQPAMRDVAKVTKRLLPHVEKYIPEVVAKKIEGFIKEQEESAEYNRERERRAIDEEAIQSAMSEVFQRQAKIEVEKLREEGTREVLREVRDKKRHESIYAQQDAVREGINRLVGYQDSVTFNYQKKSLELQYRHYFVARDLLEYFKAFAADSEKRLEAIAKNTGLPEIQKTRLLEASKGMLRDRAVGRIHDTIYDFSANFRDRLISNVKARLKDFGEEFREGFATAEDYAGQLSDAAEMGADVDPYTIGGRLGGSWALEKLSMPVAHYLGRYLAKMPTLKYGSDRVGYVAENYRELLNEWGRGTSGEDGFFGGAVRWLKELIPSFYLDERVKGDLRDDGDKAVEFTLLTRKSITEIIPGYLSRIHHELQIMRTGDPNIDRITYNIDRQEFTSREQAKKDLANRILSGRIAGNIKEQTNAIIRAVDTEGKLSDQAREALAQQLIRDSAVGRVFSGERYAKAGELTQITDEKLREEIRSFFAGIFPTIDEDTGEASFTESKDQKIRRAAITREAATQARYLQQYIPDIGKAIATYANLDQRELMRDLGLTRKWGVEDRINYNRFWDALGAFDNTASVKDEETFEGYRQSPLLNTRFDSSASGNGVQNTVRSAFGPVGEEQRPVQRTGEEGYGQRQVTILEQINQSVDKILARMSRSDAVKPDGGRTERAGVDVKLHEGFEQLPSHLERQTGAIVDKLDELDVRQDVRRSADYLEEILYTLREDRENRGFFKRSLRAGKAVGGATKSLLGGYFKSMTALYGGLFKLGGRAVGGALDIGGKLTFGLPKLFRKEKIDNVIKDLYVSGRIEPAIQAFKLRAGQYRDQITGKVIEKVEDIKGPIVDELGNVVVTAQDLVDGLRDSRGVVYVRERIDALKRRFAGIEGIDTEKLFGGLKQTSSGIMERVRGWYRSGKDEVMDIYSSLDMSKPKLLAHKLLKGEYRDQLTGKIIKSFNDIKGPVIDEVGNIVLSAEDLFHGIADHQGNRKMMRDIYDKIRRSSKDGWGKAVDAAGDLFSKAKDLFTRGKEELTDIYVRGMSSPVLLGYKLRMGMYRDQITGKVINSVKDITGPVVDEAGNVVISAQDFAKGLYDKHGKSILSKVFGLGKKLFGLGHRLASGPFKVGLDLATFAFRKTKEFLNRPFDVFVRGEDSPRLLAAIMESGGYISKATGKVIRSVKDIDGDIIDLEGRVVLTLNDMRKGLVDRFGQPIRSFAGKLRDLARKGLSVAAKLPGRVWNFYKKAISGAIRIGKGILGGVAGKLGISTGEAVDKEGFALFANEHLTLLRAIKDMLDARLPNRRGGMFDTDGDGDRDGSWQDIFQKNEEEKDKGQQESSDKEKDSKEEGGLLKKLLGGIGGLFGRGKGGDGDDDDTTIIAGGFGGGDGDDDKKGRRRGSKPRGKWGRIKGAMSSAWDWAKNSRLMRWGGRALGYTGAALGAYGAYENVKEGNYKDAAIDAGLAVGGLAMAGVAGKALAAAGGALAGLASLVSAPVLLTAAAIAAVGVGGWMLYKHLTRVKPTEFDKIRYMQYGVDVEDKDNLQKVLYLEEELWKSARVTAGKAWFNVDDKKLAELAKGFGVDTEDDVALRSWLIWFLNRFKPVFLAHATAAHKLAKGTKLLELDKKLTPKEKLEYLKMIKFEIGENNPHGVTANPFGSTGGIRILHGAIMGAIHNLEIKLREEMEKKGEKPDEPEKVEERSEQGEKDPVAESIADKDGVRSLASESIDLTNIANRNKPEERRGIKLEVERPSPEHDVIYRVNGRAVTRADFEAIQDGRKDPPDAHDNIINDRSLGYAGSVHGFARPASFADTPIIPPDSMDGAIRQREVGSSERDFIARLPDGSFGRVDSPNLAADDKPRLTVKLNEVAAIEPVGRTAIANRPVQNTEVETPTNFDREVETRKDRLEREAQALDAQNRYQNERLNRSMESVLNVLNRSYETQVSMDKSLKNMNQLLEEMQRKNKRKEVEDKMRENNPGLFNRLLGRRPNQTSTTSNFTVDLSRNK